MPNNKPSPYPTHLYRELMRRNRELLGIDCESFSRRWRVPTHSSSRALKNAD
jgi:hypothetical protein